MSPDTHLYTVLLASIRLLPILVVAPITPFSRLPQLVRVIFCLVMATVLGWSANPVAISGLTPGSIIMEFLIGMIMAFGFHAAAAAADFMGKLLDMQIGFNASAVFDPSGGHAGGMVSELLLLTMALVFVSMDFHYELLRGLSTWMSVLPPGSMTKLQMSPENIIVVFSQQFLTAFMMVMPVFLGLWLTDIAFAYMSRSMPQANIYFMALPLKVGLGILLLAMALPFIIQGISVMYGQAIRFSGLPVVHP
ncbi:MAG: flagellar biosynthetic protein FliR [Fluviicoccus sp.]|uniref:flagellar biosynthetic protein FliR n=1 Tax=Fluviicoccus sp. TaxID=2003552 RepID=UPI00271A65B8|nr:flagellar biosynthetic protein FliR [Fluviicoccus sp.]MDO8330475.1 flagellar biosynthetic protein FliR [Fluviicoccus sp.]